MIALSNHFLVVLIRWLLFFVIATRRYTIVGRRVAALRTTDATVAISPGVPVVCLVSADSPQSNLTLARFSISLCLPDFGDHVAPVCLVIIAFSYYIQYRLGPYISSFHRIFRKVSAVFNSIIFHLKLIILLGIIHYCWFVWLVWMRSKARYLTCLVNG